MASYLVIAAPPLEAGAVKVTFIAVLEVAVAETAVGAPGTSIGVMELVATEAAELPLALVAITVKV